MDAAAIKMVGDVVLHMGQDQEGTDVYEVLAVYAPDPEDENSTLVLIRKGDIGFQEMRLGISYSQFDSVVGKLRETKNNNVMSVDNMSREYIRIAPDSDFGKVLPIYKKMFVADTLYPPAPGIFH